MALQVNNIEKVFVFSLLSQNFTDFFTKQYCHVEFQFKFSDKGELTSIFFSLRLILQKNVPNHYPQPFNLILKVKNSEHFLNKRKKCEKLSGIKSPLALQAKGTF